MNDKITPSHPPQDPAIGRNKRKHQNYSLVFKLQSIMLSSAIFRVLLWILFLSIPLSSVSCLTSCSNKDGIKSDTYPIKKRLPMINEIIGAQWTSERVPEYDSLLSPPTLDVYYIIRGIITLSKSEFDALIIKYVDWESCNLNDIAMLFNIHETKGTSSPSLIKAFNKQIKPHILHRFILLQNNKIYLELECH